MSVVLLTVILSSVSAQIMDRPAATVNLIRPEFISVKQLEERVKQLNALRAQTGIANLPSDKGQILDSMISEVLLKQGAERAKIRATENETNERVTAQKRSFELQLGAQLTDQQFRELIEKQAGLAWDDYIGQVKDQIIQTKYIQQEKKEIFTAIAAPSAAEVDKRYRDNATSFINPEMVRFSQIFIDARNLSAAEKEKARTRAQNILKEYQNGVDTFENLVLKHSDDTATRYSGGDYGYLLRNDAKRVTAFGNTFFDRVFSIRTGEVQGVIESNLGYHIVKVTDHRPPKLLQLDDQLSPTNSMTVRQYLENLIMSEKQQVALRQAMQELIDTLKREADITIFEENISTG